MLLDRGSTAAVRVTFPEYRIDSRSQNLGVRCLNGLLLSILGVGRVVWHIVPLGLELSNALKELGDGGRDVGELDDVSLRSLGQIT